MPLFKPVDRFDNDVLFQATKDHSAGQGFDDTKKGNRDSNILGSCCYCYWFCSSSGFSFGTDRSNASPGLQNCQQAVKNLVLSPASKQLPRTLTIKPVILKDGGVELSQWALKIN